MIFFKSFSFMLLLWKELPDFLNNETGFALKLLQIIKLSLVFQLKGILKTPTSVLGRSF